MHQTFKIAEILPNPFRHIEHYPIKRPKVDALKESIETTGFWENIVARSVNGRAEIAYGHHRLRALQEMFRPEDEVELIVRDLDDSAMLKIMARENMEEWGSSVAVEHETIRAVVQAYAEGKIVLSQPDEKMSRSLLRYAPSFVRGSSTATVDHTEHYPYTAQTVAAFIGWTKPRGEAQSKVHDALAALELIEEGILTQVTFSDLSTTQAQAVVRQARRAMERRREHARLQKLRAERARKEAAAAAARREQAEKERQAKLAEAKRARDEAAKRKAEEEARQLELERMRARELEKTAIQKRKTAKATIKRVEVQGREQAGKIGSEVGRQLRMGEITTKDAGKVADKIESEVESEPIVYAEMVAESVVKKINRVLDPQRERLGQEVQELVRLRDSLRKETREELATNLEIVATRASSFARQIRGAHRALPAR